MSQNIMVNLEERLIPEVQLRVSPAKDGEFRVNNSYNFRMDYADDNSRCVATLIHTSASEDASALYIRVEMRGFFACEGIDSDDDKRVAHVLAYQALFPHMQAFIRTLTCDAGLPPLMVSYAPPTADSVQIEAPL